MANTTPDSDYEFVEVKVSHKIDIRLSLDDLINAVQAQANELAASKQQVDSQMADKLNQLTQLANNLKNEVGQLGQKAPGA
jgi:prefoldin subunit 5